MLNALEAELELLTFRVTLAECTSGPLEPVMATVEVPAGVLPVVVIVSVAVPDVFTEAGENDALAPAGKPLAARLTEEVNPFNVPMVTV
jgi:hypothetical protein